MATEGSPVFNASASAKEPARRRRVLQERQSQFFDSETKNKDLSEPLLDETLESQQTDRMSKFNTHESQHAEADSKSSKFGDFSNELPLPHLDGDIVVEKRKKSTIEKLSQWFSVLDWLPNYKIANLQNDVVIGMTIGVIVEEKFPKENFRVNGEMRDEIL